MEYKFKNFIITKISAELGKGLKIYTRNKVWIISDLISTPFWVIFLFLTLIFYAQYLLNNINVVTSLMWGIFLFIFMNSFMWAGNSIVQSVESGIIDNIILTNTSLTIHLLGRNITGMIDILISGVIALLTSSYIFGATLSISEPILFFISLIIAVIFYLLFASVYASLIISLRSPWIVTNVMNFVLPFLSGAIPIQLFQKNVADIIIYSPFYYITGQIASAATGVYYVDPYLMLLISIVFTVIMFFMSRIAANKLIQKFRKEGKISLI
jgi:ABC-2 type transport system permease protein